MIFCQETLSNTFDDGTCQGILLNWDNRPLDDIGIPGRISRFQIGMASVQSGLDDTQRNTDRKDFITYLGINPFSQVKNKWLSGLLFEMGAWLCNNDDRAGVSSGCNQLRIRDLGNGGRQTLFDTGTASIGRGLATFLMPGVTWEVGPYTLRVAGGFQRYEDSGTTTGRKQLQHVLDRLRYLPLEPERVFDRLGKYSGIDLGRDTL
jgi:hypothetical protein